MRSLPVCVIAVLLAGAVLGLTQCRRSQAPGDRMARRIAGLWEPSLETTER